MKKIFIFFIVTLVSIVSPAQHTRMGDLNNDNQVNITDIMTLVDIVLHGYTPFSVYPKEVIIQAGGSATVSIDGGYYYYEVVSADPNVVEASVFGMTITLKAINRGKTTVTVKDVLTFRTIDIPVIVEGKTLQLSTTEISLITGEKGTVEVITGSGSYAVLSSDEDVVTVKVQNGTVTITALGTGSATITVMDTQTGLMNTIKVMVHTPLSLSSSTLNLYLGDKETVSITSGNGCYNVLSSDSCVATATEKDGIITITAVGIGTAIITIIDTNSGKTTTIEVTANHIPLTLSSSSLGLNIGTSSTVSITSGNGNYSVESSDTNVAVATIKEDSVIVTAVDLGSTTIIVSDTNSGLTAIIEVTVGGGHAAYFKCPDDHHPHLIDLGLPSGTKWACCNIDTDNPEIQSPTNYGGYYAWGETETKTHYDRDSYIHWYPYDYFENIAGTELDVAHVKWGGDWQLPNDFWELISNCTYEWTEVDGVKGGKFIGKNGANIFLPSKGQQGSYWSSMPGDGMDYESCLIFYSGWVEHCGWGYGNGSSGRNVRPVAKKLPLTLSASSLRLNIGGEYIVSVTSGIWNLNANSSDPSVATATLSDSSIKVTAMAIGSATISVTDLQSGQMATIEVKVNEGQTAFYTCPDDNHPHMIDLGLPSGTLWACCNVDTDYPDNQSPTNYGGYYAWGETKAKSIFDYNFNYNYQNNYQNLNSDITGTQYDVANVMWGSAWCMPSYVQQAELRDNCSSEWTTINGTNGRLFTGQNGGSIFLPYGDLDFDNSSINYNGEGIIYGSYWSSTKNPSCKSNPYCLNFNSFLAGMSSNYFTYGQKIRPVARNISKTEDYLPLTLSSSSLNLNVGGGSTISITSGNGIYTVKSSNTSVATTLLRRNSIRVTAVAAGSATISVTDCRSGQTTTVEVTVSATRTSYLACPDNSHPHMINLGLPSGTLWSCCNLDTDHPENLNPSNYGNYFAWGETEKKSLYDESTYKYYDSITGYQNIGSDIAGTEYDVAYMKSMGYWQMPTYSQIEELTCNCTYEWTEVSGVKGGKFTGKNGGSIFLPAAGSCLDEIPDYAGSDGFYRSSTQDSSDSSMTYGFSFNSDGIHTGCRDRLSGESVRPVARY